jgi:hypothetical protein
MVLKLSDLGGICPRQAENVATRGIAQVLTSTAVVLIMVCLLEMAARWILVGGGVAALNAT